MKHRRRVLKSSGAFLVLLIAFYVLCQLALSPSSVFAVDDYCCGYYMPGSTFNCYDNGNCTWWALYKRPDLKGVCTGDAVRWYDQAVAAKIPVGMDPAVGSIAVFRYGTYGHVAYVEEIYSNGTFRVSEMGYKAWHCLHSGTYSATSFEGIRGFIYAPAATIFNFDNHSSDGWTPGYDVENLQQTQTDLHTWMIQTKGVNPGVVSPLFPPGINTGQFRTLRFSARVDGTGAASPGKVFLKTADGNWAHPVDIGAVPRDYNYHEYTANLYSAWPNLDIAQLSIELTENGGGERWIFDWVYLISQYSFWDFKNTQQGWVIRRGASPTDFFPQPNPDYWRISATDKQPQIAGVLLSSNLAEFQNVGIKYSVRGTNQTPVTRAYFDIGTGFNPSCYSQSSILADGRDKPVVFAIPACAKGHTLRMAFDLFDDLSLQGSLIAIDKIVLLYGDTRDDPYFSGGSGGPPPPPDPLVASFIAQPQNGTAPLGVQFIDSSSGNDITNWNWNFGDGSTSTDRNPAHTYPQAGAYVATLTVAGPLYPDVKSSSMTITVTSPPPPPLPLVASYSATPVSGVAPLSVQFTDTSTGDNITSWSWTFGDNAGSTLRSPAHIYTQPGRYTVTLSVNGTSNPNPATATGYIQVDPSNRVPISPVIDRVSQ